MQNKIPKLMSLQSGPLSALEEKILSKRDDIEEWFSTKWKAVTPPIYSSVDLRYSGIKITPIDTNLFPSGFNNLNEESFSCCNEYAKDIIERLYPGTKKILIIPESHTRNMYYFENLCSLHKLLSASGYEVRIGSLISKLLEDKNIELPSCNSIKLEPIIRKKDEIQLEDFKPDLIFLNNDLSIEIPKLLLGIKQPIVPSVELGWHRRSKAEHFKAYQAVSSEFAKLIDIDIWLITALYQYCEDVDFANRKGEEEVLKLAKSELKKIKKLYQENDIEDEPFIMLKADAGSYGMGVISLESDRDFERLNRKQRSKMITTKGGKSIDRVLLQEGVTSIEKLTAPEAVAEPVIYLFGENVVGGFYRYNETRGPRENLNSPQMRFTPMNFDDGNSIESDRFYVYSVIARLAVLASSYEILQYGEIK